ncbi:MAG: flagellar biosynthesis anti-sigma factor FlgM [Treponema sp.]|nr:flagellar biosynthesis anti-sigma factor FlgM [Treponema sp.]
MTVDRIGHVEPIPPSRKTGRSESVRGTDRTDTINVSEEAKIQAEKYQVLELIKAVPETDEARIVELRQRLDDPSYVNDRLNATADNILRAWMA